MIILDTCALLFDALTPEKLTPPAKKAINQAEKNEALYCCEISLWEIAMLIEKKRLSPGTGVKEFLMLMLQARNIETIGINIDIAALSSSYGDFKHFDPVDRIIAATTITCNAKLITCDHHFQNITDLTVVW